MILVLVLLIQLPPAMWYADSNCPSASDRDPFLHARFASVQDPTCLPVAQHVLAISGTDGNAEPGEGWHAMFDMLARALR